MTPYVRGHFFRVIDKLAVNRQDDSFQASNEVV